VAESLVPLRDREREPAGGAGGTGGRGEGGEETIFIRALARRCALAMQ